MAYTDSAPETITAPVLVGVWVHEPSTADFSIQHYLYGNVGRTESLGVDATATQLVGRAYPVYQLGGGQSRTVDLKIVVPYGPNEEDEVEYVRLALAARKTLCYRDNRKRLVYGVITDIQISDLQEGSGVTCTVNTVDYTEEV